MKDLYQKGQIFVAYGPKASVGNFYLPPFYYQLHYLVSLITNFSPVIMKYLITLVEAFTPLLLFLILKKITYERNAFFSSLIYIFASFPTIFGTSEWNPNMIPFLSTLTLFCLLEYILKNKKIALIIGLIATTIAIHLHYQAVVLIPFVFIVFCWSIIKRKTDFKYWLIGIFLSFLTFVPYFYTELNNNFTNTKNIYFFFAQEHSKYFDRVSKVNYVFNFFPEFIEKILIGKNVNYNFFGKIIFYLGMIVLSFTALVKKDKTSRWILIYFTSIFVMLRIYKGDKVEFYLSTLFILPVILISYIFYLKKYQVLTYIFILFIAYFSGSYLGSNKNYNEIKDVKNIMHSIDQVAKGKNVRLSFYNDDFVNTFAYGFNEYTQTKIDKNSLLIVEICDKEKKCFHHGKKISYLNNKIYTYNYFLKSLGGGSQYLAEIKTDPNYKYNIYISSIAVEPKGLEQYNYLIEKKFNYGSDFLLQDIIY
ncbi:hypothetical protein GYA19_06155 [Candidatus Beckwithbacteria bacterium]|nr:hypothetical protein [Candidatus Beckwithbacteria bacterium]